MDAKKAITTNETALRAKAGDAVAIAELWDECIHLVKSICHKYQPSPESGNRICDWNDLIQSSYIAFVKCLKKWEPRNNSQFTTYLTYYVREACRLEIGYYRKGVKVDMLPSASSYDIRIGGSEESDTFLDLIVDENAERSFEQVEISQMQQLVRAEVNRLHDMERETIRLHFFKRKTIVEIAEILGVSKNTAIGYERRAFSWLRKSRILQSLYIEFVSADIEANRGADIAAFRLDVLTRTDAATMLRALFDDDALEIFR